MNRAAHDQADCSTRDRSGFSLELIADEIYTRGVVRDGRGGQPAPRIAVSRYRVVAHEPRVIGKDTEFAVRRNLPVQIRNHERGALIDGEEGRADANLWRHTATLPDCAAVPSPVPAFPLPCFQPDVPAQPKNSREAPALHRPCPVLRASAAGDRCCSSDWLVHSGRCDRDNRP